MLRHAPGAGARVEVRTDGTRTTVRVVDDGPAPESSPGRGYGLVGLAERVALAGGTLATGRGRDGTGFEVRAVLPVAPAVAAGAAPWGVTAGDEGGPP